MATYVANLIPSIHKKDIQLDTDWNFEELNNTILPMYECVKGAKISGSVNEMSVVHFKRLMDNYTGTPYKYILSVINEVLDNQDAIDALIKEEFHDENLKVVTDYYKLNILKYVESIHFFNDFARMWINAVIYESTPDNHAISSPTLKGDAAFVSSLDNITSFSAAVNMLDQPLTKYLASIKNLKGHMFNESDWVDPTPETVKKLDPFKSNFMPVVWNPFYVIGMALNGWQVERHRRNQAEFDRLQLMLQELEDRKTATEDEASKKKIQETINYYSNLSNKLNIKIRKMEGGE